MAKIKNKVNCGDWHLGWGFGGNDKIGNLAIIDKDTFLWKGRSQGRHGQKWNSGAWAKFERKENRLEVTEQKGSYPKYSELIKSANELLRLNNLPEIK